MHLNCSEYLGDWSILKFLSRKSNCTTSLDNLSHEFTVLTTKENLAFSAHSVKGYNFSFLSLPKLPLSKLGNVMVFMSQLGLL